MYFKLFSRNTNFSFNAFGQVPSRHQVVQEEMKKKMHSNKLFSRSKNFSFKAFGQDTSRIKMSSGSRRNEENSIFYYFQKVKIFLLMHLIKSRQDIRWFKKK
jgi:hypothetical protein